LPVFELVQLVRKHRPKEGENIVVRISSQLKTIHGSTVGNYHLDAVILDLRSPRACYVRKYSPPLHMYKAKVRKKSTQNVIANNYPVSGVELKTSPAVINTVVHTVLRK